MPAPAPRSNLIRRVADAEHGVQLRIVERLRDNAFGGEDVQRSAVDRIQGAQEGGEGEADEHGHTDREDHHAGTGAEHDAQHGGDARHDDEQAPDPAERKAADREHLQVIPHEAKLIKLCDRIDNLGEMGNAPLDFLDTYAAESELLLTEALNGTDAGLESELAASIAQVRAWAAAKRTGASA